MRVLGSVALTVALAGLAGAGGFYLHRYLEDPPAALGTMAPASGGARAALPELPSRRPDFTLPDADGRMRRAEEWDGKLLVVNFWATWCPPCVHEIPIFNALQAVHGERGVQFLGIAIDDVENVRAFIRDEVELAYPTLHGQLDAIELSRRFGNPVGGLPFTVVVGRDGTVVRRHTGPLDRATAEALILEQL